MTRPARPVMVVDDDDDVRELLAMILDAEGYPVVPAGDGIDALRALEAGAAPCLILLDLRMPRMNGLELLRELHARPAQADIPVLVLTGDTAAATEARAAGAAGFLIKPVDVDTIVSAIHRFAC